MAQIDYEPTKLYVTMLLEEYRAIREHGRQANAFRSLVLQITAGTCAGLIATAAAQWQGGHGLTPILLLVVLPIFTSISLLTWVAEARVFKSTRTYAYLLEQKASVVMRNLGWPKGLDEQWPAEQRAVEHLLSLYERTPTLGPMGWEHWIRQRRHTGGLLTFVDHSNRGVFAGIRFGFFPAVMFLSIALGQIHLAHVPTNAFGPSGWKILVATGYLTAGLSTLVGATTMWTLRHVPSPNTSAPPQETETPTSA
jgi:hypothetical protein